ncbi:TPA: glycosyltransferase [Morganella morganii]
MTVDIILACYNGEKFISEQIQSILNQTFQEFTLYIRDDNSTDKTVEIINSFNDPRIKIITDDINCGAAGKNFAQLITVTTADIVFFSDQDDVWLPEKIQETLVFMSNKLVPCVAYVNGYVVDQNLIKSNHMIYDSNGCDIQIPNLFFLNGGIQGCALAFNRMLINKISDMSKINWYMHDQVVTFYASLYGEAIFINKPLFLYRQHLNNVVGYKNDGYLNSLTSIHKKMKSNSLLHHASLQSIKSIYELEKSNLSKEQSFHFKIFFCFLKKNKLASIIMALRYNLKLKKSNLKLLIKLIFLKKIR